MKIKLNGEFINTECSFLQELLESINVRSVNTVVEINGTIVNRELYGETELHDDDKIELISFVGGG